MNPTITAMRRPITTLMLVVALVSGGALAYDRMRVDICPSLNTPKICVYLDHVGMGPDQMEEFIVNPLELYLQYVDGIKDINTRNIQQVSLCELSFFPDTEMGQVEAMATRAMSWMPQRALVADDHAARLGERSGRLPRPRKQGNIPRGDGRPRHSRPPNWIPCPPIADGFRYFHLDIWPHRDETAWTFSTSVNP